MNIDVPIVHKDPYFLVAGIKKLAPIIKKVYMAPS